MIAIVAALAGNAVASTIVVMSEPTRAGELGSALQLTLAGRGVAIATLPAPDGALRLDRAAAAQRAAITTGADIAVWIDADAQAIDVCAVSSDGRYFRHAPLPVDGTNARVFAAIATSLVDELLAPTGGFDVHVDVRVEPTGAAPPVVAIAPPGFAPTAYPAPAIAGSVEPVRSDRTLFEIGPAMSPLTIGLDAELAFPLGRNVRLGVTGMLHTPFVDESFVIFGGALELRRVGRGRKHWDVGPTAGYVYAEDTGVVFGGFRIARVWEGPNRGTALGVTPMIATDGRESVPAIYATLRWMIPL